jgi:hypothetical protein
MVLAALEANLEPTSEKSKGNVALMNAPSSYQNILYQILSKDST